MTEKPEPHRKVCQELERLPRAAVELLSLEVLKKYVDVVFGDMF